MILFAIDKKPENIVLELNYKSEVLQAKEFATFGQALDYVKYKRDEQQVQNVNTNLMKYYCIYTAIDIE